MFRFLQSEKCGMLVIKAKVWLHSVIEEFVGCLRMKIEVLQMQVEIPKCFLVCLVNNCIVTSLVLL
jgi:hypothetical protein